MELIKNSDNYMELKINNISTALANSLRRTMISDTETIAIDILKIISSKGLVLDEMIAHILGLIPLRRTNRLVSSANFTLKKVNDTNELLYVYSGDLVCDTEDVFVSDKNIIITILGPGHEIDLIAEACVGTEKIHSKWNPTCGLSYKLNKDLSYTFFIETNSNMTSDEVFRESIDTLKESLRELKLSMIK
jgi:DNA-directed RNA polymerase subunit D